jgi:hypothetical protein
LTTIFIPDQPTCSTCVDDNIYPWSADLLHLCWQQYLSLISRPAPLVLTIFIPDQATCSTCVDDNIYPWSAYLLHLCWWQSLSLISLPAPRLSCQPSTRGARGSSTGTASLYSRFPLAGKESKNSASTHCKPLTEKVKTWNVVWLKYSRHLLSVHTVCWS